VGLGRIECEAARISELALLCPDRRSFREELLDRLERVIGFDKASLHGYREGLGEDICQRGYDTPARFADLPRFMEELEPHEIGDASRGRAIVDVEVLPHRRRDQLSFYRCFMHPERISVFTTTMWRTGTTVSGFCLARAGRGARFRAAEIRTLERLLATIRLADSFVTLLQPAREDASFEAWADHVGLSVKERAVTALVVRGLKNPEIAAVLGVSPNTVRNQLVSAFRKADVSTRTELVFVASTYVPPEHSAAVQPRWLTFVR
jgi:DNA-binding CsgD family transcriptional regulator